MSLQPLSAQTAELLRQGLANQPVHTLTPMVVHDYGPQTCADPAPAIAHPSLTPAQCARLSRAWTRRRAPRIGIENYQNLVTCAVSSTLPGTVRNQGHSLGVGHKKGKRPTVSTRGSTFNELCAHHSSGGWMALFPRVLTAMTIGVGHYHAIPLMVGLHARGLRLLHPGATLQLAAPVHCNTVVGLDIGRPINVQRLAITYAPERCRWNRRLPTRASMRIDVTAPWHRHSQALWARAAPPAASGVHAGKRKRRLPRCACCRGNRAGRSGRTFNIFNSGKVVCPGGALAPPLLIETIRLFNEFIQGFLSTERAPPSPPVRKAPSTRRSAPRSTVRSRHCYAPFGWVHQAHVAQLRAFEVTPMEEC